MHICHQIRVWTEKDSYKFDIREGYADTNVRLLKYYLKKMKRKDPDAQPKFEFLKAQRECGYYSAMVHGRDFVFNVLERFSIQGSDVETFAKNFGERGRGI